MSQPIESMSSFDPEAIIEYTTRGGARVRRTSARVDGAQAIARIASSLDRERGALLASSYEYPGRYTRWDIGFARPLLVLEGRGRSVRIAALKPAGEPLVRAIGGAMVDSAELSGVFTTPGEVSATVPATVGFFPEEQRTRQPTLLSLVRLVRDFFYSAEDSHLGLYGALGYDLAFQFEPIRLVRAREATQRDLVLYLPDDVVVVDHARSTAFRYRYEIDASQLLSVQTGAAPASSAAPPNGVSPPNGGAVAATSGAAAADDGTARASGAAPSGAPGPAAAARSDHGPGEYAATVRRALDAFARGDLPRARHSRSRPTPLRPSSSPSSPGEIRPLTVSWSTSVTGST